MVRQDHHERLNLMAVVVCLGAQAANCGNLLWEERHPEVAAALFALAESHAQQDPTFRSPLAYTRLTAAEALRQLRLQGFGEGQLPSPSTMAEVGIKPVENHVHRRFPKNKMVH